MKFGDNSCYKLVNKIIWYYFVVYVSVNKFYGEVNLCGEVIRNFKIKCSLRIIL